MSTSIACPPAQPSAHPDLFKTLSLVIDDNPDDLYAIIWGLQSIGLSCVPLRYDAFSGLQNADLLQQGLSTAKIVFLDLNLDTKPDIGSSDQANHIRDVLNKLKLQGPYILIVWSDFKADMKEVIATAFERAQGAILPVGVAVLDKEKFMDVSAGERVFDFSELGGHICKVIENFPQLSALMTWENRICAASSAVSHVLFSFGSSADHAGLCAALTDMQTKRGVSQPGATQLISSPLYDKNEISSALYAIGKAACGQHTEQYPAAAIDAGLLPMIEDKFLSSPPPQSCDEIWKKTFSDKNSAALDPQAVCKLNTRLLLDTKTPPSSKRGVWIEPKADNADTYFQDCLGEVEKNLRCSLFNLKKINEIADKGIKSSIKQARDTARVGLLECSAACDEAWKKPTVRLFLLAGLIPTAIKEYISEADSIFISEKIHLNNAEYFIVISFRHPCSLKTTVIDGDSVTTLFRVRDQLLSQITARFAAYASRPGVISIR